MTRARRTVVFVALSLAGCAGIAGAQSPVTPVHGIAGAQSAAAAAPRSSGWSTRADPKHAWLYVSGYGDSAVEIYDLVKIGTPQIGRLTQGISGPAGLALDPQGNLYVANQVGGNVTIYAPGKTTPTLTLSQGLTHAIGVAIDVNGDVYVANRNPNYILVYPQGQTSPSNAITSDLFTALCGMFFDAQRTLYVGDNSSGVLTLAHGSQQIASLGLKGVTEVGGLTLDAHGDLFVSDIYQVDIIFVYGPGDVKPKRRLRQRYDSNFLTNGAARGVDYIFAPDFFNNSVSFFKQTGPNPVGRLTTGVSMLNGVVLKPAGVP